MKKLKIFLLFVFFFSVFQGVTQNTVFDRDSTQRSPKIDIDSLVQVIKKNINQVADYQLFDIALQTRKVGKNGTLVDSMEVYYDGLGIDFMTISNMNNDEFWARAWSSKKAYGVNGKIDTANLDNQTARQVIMRIKIDSVSSMKDFKIRSTVAFSEPFKTLLSNYQLEGLETEMNTYLATNLNHLKAVNPSEFRVPVQSAMDWMYRKFLTLPEELISKLNQLKIQEETIEESWPHAYPDFQVVFSRSNDPNKTTFGFDQYNETYTAWESNYQHAKIGGNGVYYIPHASNYLNPETATSAGYVLAEFKNNRNPSITLDSLTFKNMDGETFTPGQIEQLDPTHCYIALPNGGRQKDYIVAYHKNHRIGKLKVFHYNYQERRVNIVPVGFDLTNADELAIALNQVYAQSQIKWQLEIKDQFTPESELFARGIEVPNGEGVEQYSDQMRALRREYFETHPEYEKARKQYLIFVVNSFTTSEGSTLEWDGFMPRGRGMGFVTKSAVSDGKTLAHELAHGAFGLEHTWHEGGPAQGRTTNLMDYTSGPSNTTLTKAQWDEMNRRLPVLSYKDDSEDAASSNSNNPIDYLTERLKELKESTGSEHFAIQHCELCEQGTQLIGQLEFDNWKIKNKPQNNISVFQSDISGTSNSLDVNIDDDNFSLSQKEYLFSNDGRNVCVFLYYSQDQSNQNPDKLDLMAESPSNLTFPSLLFKNQNKGYDCKEFLENSQIKDELCLTNDELPSDGYYTELLKVINQCIISDGLPLSEIQNQLTQIQSKLRPNQKAQFSQNGKVYELNSSGEVEELSDALSDQEILNGSWKDASKEVIFRYNYGESGLIQFGAIGIHNGIKNVDGKTIRLDDVSTNITETTNLLFQNHGVKDLDATPGKLGKSLDSDEFPDGKKVTIDEDEWYWKIISEAGGIGLSFLKTSQFEQKVYLEKENSVIKAPPIGTGTLEATGTVITDLTSLGTTIYSLCTSEEAQEKIVKSFTDVRDKVAEDKTALFPILGEVVLEAATNTNIKEFKEIYNSGTDNGRREHLTSRASVSTVMTVIIGGKIVTELPNILKNLSLKMVKGKKLLKFTNLDGLSKDLVDKFRKKVADLGDDAQRFLDDFKDATQDQLRKIVEFDLLDSWKKLDELGVDDLIRKNPDVLKKVKDLFDPSKFQLPGNRPTVNGKKINGDFKVKTRDGKHEIYFDKNGFPDFNDFSLGKDFSFQPKTKILDGSSNDFSKATSWLKDKFSDTPGVKIKNNGSNMNITVNGKKNTYTWHHHQDGKTLIPVLTDVHSNIAHTGGAATIKRGLEGIFTSPF